MGLFGFVVSMIGLGAMTKDAVSDSIFTSKNYNKAKENGDPYYSGAGSDIFSTETGEKCRYEYNFSTNHNVLVNAKTGDEVLDLTALKNQRKTVCKKNDLKGSGCVFYKTYEFDDNKHRYHNIYKCTMMPGYFTKTTFNNVDKYTKCNVVHDDFWGYKTENIDGCEYFEDGTGYTREKSEERRDEYKKAREIRRGKIIFPYKDEYVEGFKDLNTGELYVNYEYYQPTSCKSYPKKKLISKYGDVYKKAEMVPGKEIKYFCKKFVLVPIEGSKLYNDRGEEIVR